MAQLHICGKCNKKFRDEAEYIDHVCIDNYTPADQEHQGEVFKTISAAALERGEKLQQ